MSKPAVFLDWPSCSFEIIQRILFYRVEVWHFCLKPPPRCLFERKCKNTLYSALACFLCSRLDQSELNVRIIIYSLDQVKHQLMVSANSALWLHLSLRFSFRSVVSKNKEEKCFCPRRQIRNWWWRCGRKEEMEGERREGVDDKKEIFLVRVDLDAGTSLAACEGVSGLYNLAVWVVMCVFA